MSSPSSTTSSQSVLVCVKGPVKLVTLSKGSGDVTAAMSNHSNVTSSSPDSGSTLKLIEGRPSAVRCDAVGGYPPPVLDLFVQQQQLLLLSPMLLLLLLLVVVAAAAVVIVVVVA